MNTSDDREYHKNELRSEIRYELNALLGKHEADVHRTIIAALNAKRKPDTIQAASLAHEFAKVIHRRLKPYELAAANERNALEDVHSPVCHTADFIDSNMAMERAWKRLFAGEVDVQDAAACDLWNAAWNIAKRMNFDLVLLEAYVDSFA